MELANNFAPGSDQPEIIEVLRRMFRRSANDETIPSEMKPFSAFGASRKKPRMGYQLDNDDGAAAGHGTWRQVMRALSFILAFGLVLAGSSLAGAPDGSLPGVGTFQYGGAPLTATMPQPVVVAARF
jgi:hypothetical protein